MNPGKAFKHTLIIQTAAIIVRFHANLNIKHFRNLHYMCL